MYFFGDWGLGIGDWGLGIGDWGPIPNPQSPIPIPMLKKFNNVYTGYIFKVVNKQLIFHN